MNAVDLFLRVLLLMAIYVVLSVIILSRIENQECSIPQVRVIDTYIEEKAEEWVPTMDMAQEYVMTLEELEAEQYWDSMDLLALCVMAEAEGESELGKRLVIDAILNRVGHPDFPDNVIDVISAPNAFTSYSDGRIERVEPTWEIYRLIVEELMEQTNHEVLYFTAGDWPKYGTRLFQEGNHYFCG
ncbi:cell wall hydrolase [Candidatus Merdisoma sp. JLR.KK006]|uniref:cell wall hydrolase n=1 Tax=Candidatus Merdisoma sp. JLR.KK006 TaxID=3112626 RepID=UPI002FF29972